MRAKHIYPTRGFVMLGAPLRQNTQGLQMMQQDLNNVSGKSYTL